MNELSNPTESKSRSSMVKVVLSAMTVLLLTAMLSMLSSTPASAISQDSHGYDCVNLYVTPTQYVGGGSDHCHYVVMKAYGDWGKICEGNQVRNGCNVQGHSRIKVDVYSKVTWRMVSHQYIHFG